MVPLMTLPMVFLFASVTITTADATVFEVINSCPYTVWAASYAPGGPASGRRLDRGETWTVTVNRGTSQGRIWGRTNCDFDALGRGRCETGDCSGVLECGSYGQAPNTMAEYAIGGFGDQDFFDVSLVDGFNLPMEFGSSSSQCSQVIRCAGNIIDECPMELSTKNACNGPCAVFKTNEYCCTSSGSGSGSETCGPTTYSNFFKQRCPYAYSYPMDDAESTFTCPTRTNYTLVFCP